MLFFICFCLTREKREREKGKGRKSLFLFYFILLIIYPQNRVESLVHIIYIPNCRCVKIGGEGVFSFAQLIYLFGGKKRHGHSSFTHSNWWKRKKKKRKKLIDFDFNVIFYFNIFFVKFTRFSFDWADFCFVLTGWLVGRLSFFLNFFLFFL